MRIKRSGLLVSFLVVAGAFGQVTAVTGLLTDPSGKPLQGDVQVVTTTSTGTEIRSVLADLNGRFRAEVPLGQKAVLAAKADGYVSAEHVLAGTAVAGEIRLVLREAVKVSGRVLHPNGNAIPMAKVHVRYPGQPRTFRFGQETDAATTDAGGVFELPLVAKGVPFVLDAYSDDRAPSSTAVLQTSGDLKGATVVLRRQAQGLTAVVRRGGVPVSGIPIRLNATGDEDDFTQEDKGSMAFQDRTRRTEVSGTDGVVRFAGVPLGRFRLGVPGRPPVQGRVTAASAGVLTIDLP